MHCVAQSKIEICFAIWRNPSRAKNCNFWRAFYSPRRTSFNFVCVIEKFDSHKQNCLAYWVSLSSYGRWLVCSTKVQRCCSGDKSCSHLRNLRKFGENLLLTEWCYNMGGLAMLYPFQLKSSQILKSGLLHTLALSCEILFLQIDCS